MWAEVILLVLVGALLGAGAYLEGYTRGSRSVLNAWKETIDARQSSRVGSVDDPRGRVPLLGWVAVVPGAASAQADATAGDDPAQSVEGGGAAGTEVSDEQAAELEAWWAKQEGGEHADGHVE